MLGFTPVTRRNKLASCFACFLVSGGSIEFRYALTLSVLLEVLILSFFGISHSSIAKNVPTRSMAYVGFVGGT
jgi:hypothetical protein